MRACCNCKCRWINAQCGGYIIPIATGAVLAPCVAPCTCAVDCGVSQSKPVPPGGWLRRTAKREGEQRSRVEWAPEETPRGCAVPFCWFGQARHRMAHGKWRWVRCVAREVSFCLLGFRRASFQGHGKSPPRAVCRVFVSVCYVALPLIRGDGRAVAATQVRKRCTRL